MTSTYTSNQGLEKPATGDRSGTWGTMTNTNMDILDRAISGVGALSLTGTTTTLTTSDGSASDGNYKVLVLGGSPSGTNTITLSPNDADKLYFVVNASGQSVVFTQGTGANVTVANGAADIIYADGAGGGAAVASVLAKNLVFGGDIDVDGTANLDAVDIDGAVQIDSTVTVGVDDTGYDVKFFGATSGKYWLWDESADGAVQQGTLTVGVDDTGYDVKFFGATSGAYMLWDESADDLVLAGAAGIDLAGDLDVDGTANLDIVDVDGAANFAADVTFADGADIITATAGTSNVRVGVNAGINIASGGNYNVLIGDEAGNDLTTGDFNIAVGYAALDAATTNLYNIAIGYQALTAANNVGGTIANANTAIGYYTQPNITTGSNNTSCGAQSMQNSTTSVSNAAMGYLAQSLNTTGSYNTAQGQQALYTNRTGYGNTAVGYVSMYSNDAAIYNTSVGYQSLYYATAGYNTAVGAFALMGAVGTNDGIQNTCLGYTAGSTLTTGDNNIVIGYTAQPAAATTNNSITLGNSSIAALRCQITTIASLSDERDKQDIDDLPVGLDFINSLRPVKFTWNMRDGGKVGVEEAGFIAQELDAAQQAFDAEEYLQLVLKDNPDKLEASPGKLIPMLVKAVQELSAEVKELKEKLDA